MPLDLNKTSETESGHGSREGISRGSRPRARWACRGQRCTSYLSQKGSESPGPVKPCTARPENRRCGRGPAYRSKHTTREIQAPGAPGTGLTAWDGQKVRLALILDCADRLVLAWRLGVPLTAEDLGELLRDAERGAGRRVLERQWARIQRLPSLRNLLTRWASSPAARPAQPLVPGGATQVAPPGTQRSQVSRLPLMELDVPSANDALGPNLGQSTRDRDTQLIVRAGLAMVFHGDGEGARRSAVVAVAGEPDSLR